MKKRLRFAVLAVACASLALGGGKAFADPDSNHSASGLTDPVLSALITDDDLFSVADLTALLDPPGSNATQHYGPYANNTSPDSGTCGNDWATDTFDRHFTVKSNADGTFTVVEQFKNGSFVTMAGFSPGACEPPPSGGMIGAGKTGTMHGYFIVPLPPGEVQTSKSPFCDAANSTNADCTTTTFIDTHFTACYFGGVGTCPVTTFFFHYSAGDQLLIQHEWKNASPDRGGNHGDIRSS